MISGYLIEQYIYNYLNRYSHPGYTLRVSCVEYDYDIEYAGGYRRTFSPLPYKWYHYSPLGICKTLNDGFLMNESVKYSHCQHSITHPPIINIALIPEREYTATIIPHDSPAVLASRDDIPQPIEYDIEHTHHETIGMTIRDNSNFKLLKQVQSEITYMDELLITKYSTDYVVDFIKLDEKLSEFEDWYNKNISK